MTSRDLAVAVTFLFAACGGVSMTRQRAQPTVAESHIEGSWEVFELNRGSRMFLSFKVDSVSNGTTLHGSMIRLLAGDVVSDPSGFSPLVGSVTPDRSVQIEFRDRKRGVTVISLSGRVVGDKLIVSRLAWGGEDVTAGGREWQGRRISGS